MNRSSRRLLLITNEFRPGGGGVATYCYSLVRAMHELGWKVMVIAARKSAIDRRFDETQAFPIYRVVEHPFRPFRHLLRLKVLLRETRAYGPACLWAADWRAGLGVCAQAALFGLPYVITAYGSEILLAGISRRARFAALRVYNGANAVLAISQYTRRLLLDLGVEEQRIVVISLGVDPFKWQAELDEIDSVTKRHNLAEKKVILTLARLTPRKGQDTVIRALPAVLEHVPDAVYIIAGQGPDEARLRKLVAELKLEDCVVFAGFVSEEDKAAYYHACDVYAMLSRQQGYMVEGFGLTLLEAGACGKPVVAGRHGGVEDAVLDGETGLLVHPEDVDETAQALVAVLTDPQQAACLGQNARSRVETEANWSNVARQTLSVFERVM
jgi:phosphatidyl-myo-inositol dimannoside synthase